MEREQNKHEVLFKLFSTFCTEAISARSTALLYTAEMEITADHHWTRYFWLKTCSKIFSPQ